VALWTQILSANAAPVAEVLHSVAADLTTAAHALSPSPGPSGSAAPPGSAAMSDMSPISDLLGRGRAGVARIPGKHGGQPRSFAVVQVVIADRPGELARVFQAAGDAGVNIEDVRIEHSPGLPTGVAEISVRPSQADALRSAVTAGGWTARR
jgi:prephenate dehydrogenase